MMKSRPGREKDGIPGALDSEAFNRIKIGILVGLTKFHCFHCEMGWVCYSRDALRSHGEILEPLLCSAVLVRSRIVSTEMGWDFAGKAEAKRRK
jgi:hypothetical protein